MRSLGIYTYILRADVCTIGGHPAEYHSVDRSSMNRFAPAMRRRHDDDAECEEDEALCASLRRAPETLVSSVEAVSVSCVVLIDIRASMRGARTRAVLRGSARAYDDNGPIMGFVVMTDL